MSLVRSFTRTHPLELKLHFSNIIRNRLTFFEAIDLHRTLNLNYNAMDSSLSRIIWNERKIVQLLGLIWMSLVRTGRAGVIIALWCALRNNGQVLMRTSHGLLRNNVIEYQWCQPEWWKFQWSKPRTVRVAILANVSPDSGKLANFESVRLQIFWYGDLAIFWKHLAPNFFCLAKCTTCIFARICFHIPM